MEQNMIPMVTPMEINEKIEEFVKLLVQKRTPFT